MTTIHGAQDSLHNWMVTAGQTARRVPTAAIPDDERILRARLVLEEAVEFVEAMGCEVVEGLDGKIKAYDVGAPIDLVEAADAIADIMVVTIGSAVTLGVDAEPVYREVMRSNWEKFPGGVATRDEYGKVVKPAGYQPPNIAKVLKRQGWDG